MKKRFFYSHPIIGGLIALLLVTIICNGIGAVAMLGTAIVDLRTDVVAGMYPDVQPDDLATVGSIFKEYMGKDLEQTVFNGTVALAALLCLPIFYWLNRKNGYRGPFKIQGTNLKIVWVCIAIFAVLDISVVLIYLFTLPGGFPQIPVPTFAMLVLALYAGINEEIIDRAIPAALMLRNKPTSRRIWATVLLTALIFGLTHLGNMLAGQELVQTLFQTLFACGMGLFFAGIYLRTGSITLTIIIHALHDLMVFVLESAVTLETTNAFVDALSWVNSLAPFVLGVLMLLPKYHPAIIETWTRIWPEKNMPAAENVGE